MVARPLGRTPGSLFRTPASALTSTPASSHSSSTFSSSRPSYLRIAMASTRRFGVALCNLSRPSISSPSYHRNKIWPGVLDRNFSRTSRMEKEPDHAKTTESVHTHCQSELSELVHELHETSPPTLHLLLSICHCGGASVSIVPAK